MKRFIGFLAFIATCAIVLWLTRERLLPAPRVPEGPPARFRSTPPEPRPEEPQPDDLTVIKGIGPVYAASLVELGITTFGALAAADPDQLAAQLATTVTRVSGWIDQARQH
jgi:predicted flap endonuclease-1-like 5' DNA nuclease